MKLTLYRYELVLYNQSISYRYEVENEILLHKRIFGPEKGRLKMLSILGTFSANSAGQLDVLGHDGDPLGVNRAKVGVLEQSDEVGLAGFLQGHDGRALEAEISLEVLSDLADQSLERQLANQKLRALLVTTNLTKRDSSRTVTMRLLHTTSCGSALACSFRRQLLTRGLASGRLASGLLGSCHLECCSYAVRTTRCSTAI